MQLRLFSQNKILIATHQGRLLNEALMAGPCKKVLQIFYIVVGQLSLVTRLARMRKLPQCQHEVPVLIAGHCILLHII
jgi:hypothetical protein